jgi:outer membrane protein assembly factor BamB
MDQEYNEAPESPHVLWTKVMTTGGLAGGDLGVHSMEHGDAYEGKWPNRLILAGRLYYETGPYERPKYIYCVDVRTGEQLWAKVFYDNLSIAQGQMLYFSSFNYHGVFSYLWFTSGSTWYAHNPLTGEWVYTMTDVPSGTNIIGPSGEICVYTISTSGGYMRVWNSTRAGLQNATGMQAGSWGSRVSLRTINVTYYGWEEQITIPTGYPGSVEAVGLGDRIIGVNEDDYSIDIWGINLNASEGDVGEELFSVTWDFDDAWLDANVTFVTYGSGWTVTDLDSKIGLVWAKELRQYYAFSLDTGSLMWIQEVPQVSYLDVFGIGARVEYGRVYTVGMAGNLHCFNATNGKLLWIYNATDYYSENLWGNNWNVDIDFISGGKIYLFHSEHSPVNPLFRDAPALCINATTGEEIWRANGLLRTTDWGGSAIMGDSVITMYNSYDQRIWTIGKGPSATAVSAAPKVSVEGDMVLVEGMVTDVSPATNDDAVAMRFPNGVPAVSDESQGEWMKYVYAQFARPTDATGVEVIISVLDPNNNCYEVARTTSDASGFFSAEFIPEVPGKYTVVATFEGSGAYYGSFAETAISVEETPQASPTPTPSPAPLTDLYVTGFGIGMIIAIVVVGLLLFLMLRKR